MITESKTKSPIADDLSQMKVVLSMPCRRCGYELKELEADGDCPECGEPIRLTIIEVVDPTSRRLQPIHKPKTVGNLIAGVVLFYFVAIVIAVLALVSRAPESLPIPSALRSISTISFVWTSALISIIALTCLIPMMRMCQRQEIAGCRKGIVMTFSGLWFWAISMGINAWMLLNIKIQSSEVAMLIDTCLPVVSAGLVFSGFRHLIPRLGQRSRAFRQAQGSRQRMNDLLAALIVIIIGRTFLAVSDSDSNLALLGLIIMVMSLSLIVIGLGYLLRNVIWIRNALITPPPALIDLLHLKG